MALNTARRRWGVNLCCTTNPLTVGELQLQSLLFGSLRQKALWRAAKISAALTQLGGRRYHMCHLFFLFWADLVKLWKSEGDDVWKSKGHPAVTFFCWSGCGRWSAEVAALCSVARAAMSQLCACRLCNVTVVQPVGPTGCHSCATSPLINKAIAHSPTNWLSWGHWP